MRHILWSVLILTALLVVATVIYHVSHQQIKRIIPVKRELTVVKDTLDNFYISPGTYNCFTIEVIVTDDINTLYPYIKQNVYLDITKEDLLTAEAYTFTDPDGNLVLWFRNISRSTEDISTISHECLHATIRIMDAVHIPLTEDSEEAFTYQLDFLTSQIFKHVK